MHNWCGFKGGVCICMWCGWHVYVGVAMGPLRLYQRWGCAFRDLVWILNVYIGICACVFVCAWTGVPVGEGVRMCVCVGVRYFQIIHKKKVGDYTSGACAVVGPGKSHYILLQRSLNPLN